MDDKKTINDRSPNFREDGDIYLVRCFAPVHGDCGRENWVGAVADGVCAWCGWEEPAEQDGELSEESA